MGESLFWQDLQHDMKDPEFAEAYVAESELLAGTALVATVLEEQESARDTVIQVSGLEEFAQVLMRLAYPDEDEEWIKESAGSLVAEVEADRVCEGGPELEEESSVREPAVFKGKGRHRMLRLMPLDDAGHLVHDGQAVISVE